jgi:hypothetical protein
MITRKLIVYVVLTLSVIVTICSVKPHKTKGTFGEQKSSRGYDVEEAVENKESEVDEAVGNEESKVEEAVENNDRNRNEESKGGDFDKGFNKDIVNKDDLFAMSSRHLTTSSSSSSNPTLSPKTIHQIFKKHEPELYDSFNAKGMTITNQHVIAGSFHMEFENMTGDYPKTKSVLIGLDSRDEFGNVPMTIDWVKEFYFENSGNGYAIEVEDVYFDTKLNEFILVGSYRRGRISGLAGFILRVNVAGEVVKGNYFIKVETLTSVVPWHESNDGEHGYMVVGKEKLFKNSIVQRAVVMSVEFSLESSEPKCSAGVLGRGAFGEVHKYSTFHQVIQYTDESNSSGGLRKAFAMVGATQLHDLTESTAENFLPRECHQESEVILTIVNKDCGFAMSKSFGVSKPSESDSVNQRGFSLVQDSDSDGGLIITGSTARTSISTGRCEVEPDEMLTLKVDRLGLVKWSRSYQINYVSYVSSKGFRRCVFCFFLFGYSEFFSHLIINTIFL